MASAPGGSSIRGSLYRLGDKSPQLSSGVWIAPGAHVMGNVSLAKDVGIWFNATLRGDQGGRIAIGEGTNIQPVKPLAATGEVVTGEEVQLSGP